MSKRNNGNLYPEVRRRGENVLWDFPLPANRRVCKRIMLNGHWRLDYGDFHGECNVPFPVETPLSGVNILPEPDQVLVYRKKVDPGSIPDGMEAILVFQSVSSECRIMIDGIEVASHRGAYTPFEVSLKNLIFSEKPFLLTVEVRNPADSSPISCGKQALKPNLFFYTTQTGIIGGVCLDIVRENRIKAIQIRTYPEKKGIAVRVDADDENRVATLRIEGETYYVSLNEFTFVMLKDAEKIPLWSLEDPRLIEYTVTLGHDTWVGCFGYRSISIKKVNGVSYVCLNDRPVLLKGVLDQGYYPYGGYVCENFSSLEKELRKIKALGFNCVRIHQRTMPEQYLDLCDRIGLLVMQDFPSGGSRPYRLRTTLGLVRNGAEKDSSSYRLFGREDISAREEFERMGRSIIRRGCNHPSVFSYCIFNEGWGEYDSARLYSEFKKYDPTRLFDTCSGWYRTPHSDFYSVHRYFFLNVDSEKGSPRPFILSECGGLDKVPPLHTLRIKPGMIFQRHPIASLNLKKAYKNLFVKKIRWLISDKGLAGFIYTQLSDVEGECNGLFTFGREGLKEHGLDETVTRCNQILDSTFAMVTTEMHPENKE